MTDWHDPAPGERETVDRTWNVVRRAYEERLHAPRRRDWRPIVAVAAVVAIFAAALSPPGLAVWSSLRDAVGNEDRLLALPTRGRLLVNANEGAWVVSRDGSKRFLAGYVEAVWSPHGKYVAAVRGNQLVALEPTGKVHWQLPRRGRIHNPQWSYEGYRIAYFAGDELRVVNGDGTGDRLLTRAARADALAWEPGTHALAYVHRNGNIAVTNVDRANTTAFIRARISPQHLEWTRDRRLVAAGRRAVGVFGRRGPQLSRIGVSGLVAARMSPDGKHLALVERRGSDTAVHVDGEQVFRGAGTIDDAFWSPDGRWLLLDWTSADQWLFVRSSVRRLIAVSNVRATYGDGASLEGWCCP